MGIERQEAERLFETFAELLRDELAKLSEGSRKIFWQMLHDSIGDRAKCNVKANLMLPVLDDEIDIEDALEKVERIVEKAENVPEAGWEFAESVSDTAREIGEAIEQHKRVTDGQWTALDNMEAGLDNWLL